MATLGIIILSSSLFIHATHAHAINACFADLDRELMQAAQRGAMSGVVRITRHGELMYEKSFGQARSSPATPMTSAHMFDIASVAKNMTAAAILKLEEQGKLSLQDPISKYLPGVPPPRSHISLLELITHRSGLGYPPQRDLDRIVQRHLRNHDALLTALVQAMPSRPRSQMQFEYNNYGYALLAHIISKAAGKPMETFLREELFAPAQSDCGFRDGRSTPVALRAVGRLRQGRGARAGDAEDDPTSRGATGIICSAKGLTNWTDALMSDRIFSGARREKYFFLTGLPDRYRQGGEAYSFGWEIGSNGTVRHGGADQRGFFADTLLDTRQRTSVVVLSNSEQSETAIRSVTRHYETKAKACLDASERNTPDPVRGRPESSAP